MNTCMSLDVSPAGELWRRTLSQIPTLFGKLVYLSSLRNSNTGTYEHFGFAQRFTAREADRTLQRSHLDMFADWLSFSLEQQTTDLERYLAGLTEDSRAVLANWRLLPPFANLIPASAKLPERDLFLSDLVLVLATIELGAAGRTHA